MKKIISIALMLLLLVACESKKYSVNPIYFSRINHDVNFTQKTSSIVSTLNVVYFDASEHHNRTFKLSRSDNLNVRYSSVSALLTKRNGERIPLKIEFESEIIRNLNGGTNIYQTPLIDLPPTESGEIVNISYKLEVSNSDFRLNLPDQRVDSVGIVVRGHPFKVEINGAEQLVNSDGSQSNKFEWLFDFSKTKFLPSKLNEKPMFVATTFSDWGDVVASDSTNYMGKLSEILDWKKIGKKSDFHSTLKGSETDRVEFSVRKAYEYIINNFKYGLNHDPRHMRNPRSLTDILDTRTGDCKDLSLLFIKFLSDLNIQSEPVLVPNPGSVKLPRFNSIANYSFDHVIVYVPQMEQYIDLTAGPLSHYTSTEGAYHHAFGLHLFSGKYEKITSKGNNLLRVFNELELVGNKWRSRVNVDAYGMARIAVKAGEKYLGKTLEKKLMSIDAESLKVIEQQALAKRSLAFGYHQISEKSNDYGAAVHFPYIYRLGGMLEFENTNNKNVYGKSICFDHRNTEEIIRIKNVKHAPDLDGLDFQIIRGIGRSFRQKIGYENERQSVIIRRISEVDEDRLYCPQGENNEYQAYRENVKELMKHSEQQLIQRLKF